MLSPDISLFPFDVPVFYTSSPPLGAKSLPELFPNLPSKASKMPERVPTVTRSATPTPAIPVTVDSFQNPSASEGHKTATVTSVVTPTPHDQCHC